MKYAYKLIARSWKTMIAVGIIAMVITVGILNRNEVKEKLQFISTENKPTDHQYKHLTVPSDDVLYQMKGVQQYKHLTIPSDEILYQMKEAQLDDIYHRYLTKPEVFCSDIVRIGKKTDGGWDICADNMYRPREKCLVYSFGISYDFSFDDAMAERYGCEVHSFDPSMKTKDHMHSIDVSFHATGLSNSNDSVTYKNVTWRMRTFEQLRRELNHNQVDIDVLKMDIEGWEWHSLPEMMKSGSLSNVRQLAVEFHLSGNIKMMKGNVVTMGYYLPRLQVIRELHNFGFRIFYTNKNMHCTFSNFEKTNCHEVSFIQTKI